MRSGQPKNGSWVNGLPGFDPVIQLAHLDVHVVAVHEAESSCRHIIAGQLEGQPPAGVAGSAAAGLLVGRVRRRAAGIADRGYIDAFAGLPEFALPAPEAAHPKIADSIPCR